jgi:arylsulfatase A-like enzyme
MSRSAARVLLLALAGACAPEAPAPPERVLLIVVDTTHAAHLGCHGGPGEVSPAIDALAAGGRRFAHAHSNNTWTLPSTVSLLSGQLQETHGVVTNHHKAPPGLSLLPELFAEAGYRTAGFVQMVYASAVYGLDRGFDEYQYYSMTAGAHPSSMAADVADFVAANRDERWFAYVHWRQPHSPYNTNPLAQQRLAPGCPLAGGEQDRDLGRADSLPSPEFTDEQAAHVEHLYRANIANADRSVGDLLRRLDGDDSVLVLLTSDHGEALGQHGVWGHGYRLESECVNIPLIVSGPGIAPGVDQGAACTVDVVPTLADAADLRLPDRLDGRSLLPRLLAEPTQADRGHDERPIPLSGRYIAGQVPNQGVVSGRFKLILDYLGESRLYDLEADPGEQVDVSAEHPDVTERLSAFLHARRAAGQGLAEKDTQSIDVREEELRALGYLR